MVLTPVPPELRSYSAKLLVGTARQDITGAVFIFVAILILKITLIPMKARLVIAAIIVLFGVLFIFAKLDEKIINLFNLKRSFKNVSYYDPKMDSFIQVNKIQNNAVDLTNGQQIGIIKVEPIDLEILDPEEQEEVITNFLKFLNSLDNDFSIISISKPVNIDNWLFNLESKIYINNKKNRLLQLQQHKSFEGWVKDMIDHANVRDRAFYLVLKAKGALQLKSFKDIFSKNKPEDEEESMDERTQRLTNLINNSIQRIKATKIDAAQLNSNEILTLFASFFSDQNIVSEHFTSPISFPEREVEYL